MTFRQDSLNFYQCKIAGVVMLITSLALIPMLGVGYSLLFVILSVIFILLNPKLYKTYITINEIGILCHASGQQLWAYEWDSIAELKRSRRYLLPSIEVITYDKDGKTEPFAGIHKYFQLGKEAKEALRRYYKPVEQLRKV